MSVYFVSEYLATRSLSVIVNQIVKERNTSLLFSSEPNNKHLDALLSGGKSEVNCFSRSFYLRASFPNTFHLEENSILLFYEA